MPIFVDWNGRDFPEAMKDLPAGRYVIEPVDETAVLTAEEEAGIEAAIRSIRDGRGVDEDRARAAVEDALKR